MRLSCIIPVFERGDWGSGSESELPWPCRAGQGWDLDQVGLAPEPGPDHQAAPPSASPGKDMESQPVASSQVPRPGINAFNQDTETDMYAAVPELPQSHEGQVSMNVITEQTC